MLLKLWIMNLKRQELVFDAIKVYISEKLPGLCDLGVFYASYSLYKSIGFDSLF